MDKIGGLATPSPSGTRLAELDDYTVRDVTYGDLFDEFKSLFGMGMSCPAAISGKDPEVFVREQIEYELRTRSGIMSP